MKPSRCSSVLTGLAMVVMTLSASADEEQPGFKIYVEHSGVYEVTFERLVLTGLDGARPSEGIGVRNMGQPVPVWIEDGGDGEFGPGDRLLFVGEVLRGSYSYLDPHSRFNCYRLSFADSQPQRGEDRPAESTSAAAQPGLMARHHLEVDRMMVRFRPKGDAQEESWYWERLTVAGKEIFGQELAIEGLARDGDAGTSPSSVRLRLGLRGWSEPRHRERMALPHHDMEILFNKEVIGRAVWDGKDHFVHETEIPASRVLDGVNQLNLKIPKRFYPESGDFVVDVVLLNWIEIEYAHIPVVGNEQLKLYPDGDGSAGVVEIRSDDQSAFDAYLAGGVRYRSSDGRLTVPVEVDGDGFSVLKLFSAADPKDVVLDRSSKLRIPDRQADYIMITHKSLRRSAKRLAKFHRGNGLSVALVDAQDIYDEFNFGILNPQAIKDFLQYAHSNWRAPAPRFVLFIGDASWDFKNDAADDSNYADWTYRPGEKRRFAKNASTPYSEGAELNHRNLVPTSSYPTLEGHAASDTWFVCLDDGDDLPDMAIGRLPVVTNGELEKIIDKTIAFAKGPPVGPWRRNLLFIANESPGFQRRSDEIADRYGRLGYAPTKIYPHPSEPANEHHTQRIIEILDGGVLAVHFIGHGGRYIWRTGPPDLQKNHDLFTLDHLDNLDPNTRLPVVLSLTCYSAPFDHPTADSIGEKLVRIPERGAVAVFAASWRNSPSPVMGDRMLAELTTPGNTIGEAVMRAKHEFGSPVLIQTYNLLGDPAVKVGAPDHSLDLSFERAETGPVLRVGIPEPVGSGEMMVGWIAGDGSVIREDQLQVSGTVFELELETGDPVGGDDLAGARVYVWDEERRIDGIGWVAVTGAEEAANPEVPTGDASAANQKARINREPR